MFIPIEEALQRYRDGEMLILIDDENRENEGDLVMAAEHISPEAVNFMVTHGRGMVCVPLTEDRASKLGLSPMCPTNTALNGTHFTVTVDAKRGISTGISSYDRAHTIRLLVDKGTGPDDLARPGHIFPLIARNGGVLRRAGHTEATVDLARLAGLEPIAVLCEVLNEDGTMARVPQLQTFSKKHGVPIACIADLIEYRKRTERLISRELEANLPTQHGTFKIIHYVDQVDGSEHVALVAGDVAGKKDVLVAVHTECFTGDVFGSTRCSCGSQLQRSLKMIGDEGQGVLLYARQQGRGVGLESEIEAHLLHHLEAGAVESNETSCSDADLRDYGTGAQILNDLGLTSIRVLTNNPRRLAGTTVYGLTITEQIPTETRLNGYNRYDAPADKTRISHHQ